VEGGGGGEKAKGAPVGLGGDMDQNFTKVTN